MEIGVKQAASLLKVSEKTIYRWVSAQRVPFYRVGSQYRFSRNELLKWASNAGSAESLNGIDVESSVPDALPPTSLFDSLRAGGIFYRLGGVDVPSVLEEILGMMRLPEGLDLPRIRDLLCEREQVATTGLGDGVAFPHCRDIALPGLSFPVVSLAFLEHAIDFSAIDNQPVKIVFTLLSPSSAQSIRLMSRLAYAVRKPAFLEQLKAEAPRDSIFQAAKEVDMELDAGR
jgi:PTS system nitrogen regulatory IIA component